MFRNCYTDRLECAYVCGHACREAGVGAEEEETESQRF